MAPSPSRAHAGSMSSSTLRPTAATSIPWALVLVLAGVALTRPLLNMTGLAQLWGKPATPLIATAAITGIWVMAMVLSRHPRPVQTLVLVGLDRKSTRLNSSHVKIPYAVIRV